VKTKFPSLRDRKDQAKRAALRVLRKTIRQVDINAVELSDWEGEFLGSLERRVEKYGRAFADVEKGGAESALSLRQSRKLKEISGKAQGWRPHGPRAKSLGRAR